VAPDRTEALAVVDLAVPASVEAPAASEVPDAVAPVVDAAGALAAAVAATTAT